MGAVNTLLGDYWVIQRPNGLLSKGSKGTSTKLYIRRRAAELEAERHGGEVIKVSLKPDVLGPLTEPPESTVSGGFRGDQEY